MPDDPLAGSELRVLSYDGGGDGGGGMTFAGACGWRLCWNPSILSTLCWSCCVACCCCCSKTDAATDYPPLVGIIGSCAAGGRHAGASGAAGGLTAGEGGRHAGLCCNSLRGTGGGTGGLLAIASMGTGGAAGADAAPGIGRCSH